MSKPLDKTIIMELLQGMREKAERHPLAAPHLVAQWDRAIEDIATVYDGLEQIRFAACVGLWKDERISESRACEIVGTDILGWRYAVDEWLDEWVNTFHEEAKEQRANDPEFQDLLARNRAWKAAQAHLSEEGQ